MDLQQIGLQHPRIRQLRNVRDNGAPSNQGFLVAEGLWAHNVLLDQNASIEVFLWCPEAAYSAEALVRSKQAVSRASHAYRVSPLVLARPAPASAPERPVPASRPGPGASHAYRVSPRVLARLAERDRPDGMISLVRLPRWGAGSLSLGPAAMVLVAGAGSSPR